jgi:multidrug efflux pump subunit AcrB
MEGYKIKNIAGYLCKVFLRNPLTPILAVAILLLGFVSLQTMPREEDPQIEVSGGAVVVAMPGATPKEILNVIVKPLERKIREIKGVEHIYGTAMNNFGVVNVQYYIGEDRESSNLKLYDKVMQNMDRLPKGTMPPLVKPFDIDIDIPILTVAFYQLPGVKPDVVELYRTIRELQQEINALENVSKTTLKGVKRPQFNVFVDLHKLSAYHISLGQVAGAIKSISTNAPLIDTQNNEGKLVVFGVENAIDTVEDLQDLIIAEYMGSPIYLKNIARVEYSYDIQNYQSALISYQKGMDTEPEIIKRNKQYKEDENRTADFRPLIDQITMTVSKLKGTNAVLIAEEAIKKIQEAKEELNKAGVGFVITRNYGERANEAVNELVHHLEITILIIMLILIPFLGWRESMVVTVAVPMILATTLFIAQMSDQTINRITLFAFLLSLGLIVDDAIIVIENIHRRLHLDIGKKSYDQIIIEATDEIGPSTNIATIAIILTMVPMAFVGGMMGQFMKPIPLNVPVGLAVSLFVAYVFAPYMARKFVNFKKIKKEVEAHRKHHEKSDDANKEESV